MAIKIKCIDGSLYVDDRPTIEEWLRAKIGRFGIVVEIEIRPPKSDLEAEEVWALIRTESEWEPQWIPVAEEVLYTTIQVAEIRKARMVSCMKTKLLARKSGLWKSPANC